MTETHAKPTEDLREHFDTLAAGCSREDLIETIRDLGVLLAMRDIEVATLAAYLDSITDLLAVEAARELVASPNWRKRAVN